MRKSKRYILNKQIIILIERYISLVKYLVHIDKFNDVSEIMEDISFMIDEIYHAINKKKWKNIIDFSL